MNVTVHKGDISKSNVDIIFVEFKSDLKVYHMNNYAKVTPNVLVTTLRVLVTTPKVLVTIKENLSDDT